MRLDSIEASFPAELPKSLPIRLIQTPSRAGSLLKLLILLPASIALLSPFILIGVNLAGNPSARAVFTEQPQSSVMLLAALAFWAVLFGWPVQRIASTVARLRTVTICNGSVSVADAALFGDEARREPLSAYSGVAHNVRSSLSGVRHELVLVHPNREKSVLLAIAPRFSQAEIDHMCQVLRMTEVSSKLLYGFSGSKRPVVAELPQTEPLQVAA